MTMPSASEDPSCGQEMSESAEVPEKWRDLVNHVASNLELHAAWVGAQSSPARQENEALLNVAREYRSMSAAAGRAAALMRAMRDIAPVAHDPSRLDPRAQARWMRAKIQMQRDFAALLLHHAEQAQAALAQIEGGLEPGTT